MDHADRFDNEESLCPFQIAHAGGNSLETVNPALLDNLAGLSGLQSFCDNLFIPECETLPNDANGMKWDAFCDLPYATTWDRSCDGAMLQSKVFSSTDSSFSKCQSDSSFFSLSSNTTSDRCADLSLPSNTSQPAPDEALKDLSETLVRSSERLEALLERAVKCIERSTPCQHEPLSRNTSVNHDQNWHTTYSPQTTNADIPPFEDWSAVQTEDICSKRKAFRNACQPDGAIARRNENTQTHRRDLSWPQELQDFQGQQIDSARSDRLDFMPSESDPSMDFLLPTQSMASTSLLSDDSFTSISSTPSSTSISTSDFKIRKRRKRQPKIMGHYTCVDLYCGKAFDTAGELSKHEKVHAPRDQHPYRCQQCGKAFIYPKDLRRHLATASHNQL